MKPNQRIKDKERYPNHLPQMGKNHRDAKVSFFPLRIKWPQTLITEALESVAFLLELPRNEGYYRPITYALSLLFRVKVSLRCHTGNQINFSKAVM